MMLSPRAAIRLPLAGCRRLARFQAAGSGRVGLALVAALGGPVGLLARRSARRARRSSVVMEDEVGRPLGEVVFMPGIWPDVHETTIRFRLESGKSDRIVAARSASVGGWINRHRAG